MAIKHKVLKTICIIFVGIYSCSYQATIPTRLTYTPTPVFTIPDSNWTQKALAFANYIPEPVQFYEPKLEIRDSFSALEKSYVGVSEYDLFARRTELILNLADLAEKDFVFPMKGARLISKYGRRNGRRHQGMDLKINCQDTVVSAFDGIVRLADMTYGGYGKVIVIRHYNGLETVYSHNSKHFVQSGDHVSAGDPISVTGKTGRATTDHLHFEIRVNGIPIDPSFLIDFESQTLHYKCLIFSPNKKGQIKIETVSPAVASRLLYQKPLQESYQLL